jgi:hypothetical protein
MIKDLGFLTTMMPRSSFASSRSSKTVDGRKVITAEDFYDTNMYTSSSDNEKHRSKSIHVMRESCTE